MTALINSLVARFRKDNNRKENIMSRHLNHVLVGLVVASVSFIGLGHAALLENNANLELWLRADAGVVTDGLGNVTQWQDQSGNTRHAAPGTNPNSPPSLSSNVFNGRPAIAFDSSQEQYLIPSLPTAGNESTLFTVYEGTGKILVTRKQNRSFHLQADSATRYTFRARNSGGWDFRRDFANYSGARIGAASYVNGVNLQVGVNGAYTSFTPESAWQELGNPMSPAIGVNAGSPNPGYAEGGGHFNGHIAEIIYFNRVLNSAERVIMENHLAAKYGSPLAAAADKYAGDTSALGNYDRDVIGIGAENDGANLSSSLAGITLDAASLDPGDYLLAGHRVETNSLVIDSADGILLKRSNRVWYLDKTGELDATLTFDFAELGIAPPNQTDFYLLYSSVNSFEFTILDTVTLVGDQTIFTLGNASLLDGYYTVAAIPEPSSLALLGLGGLLALRRRR